MDLRAAIEKYKKYKIPSPLVICERASQYSKTCLLIVIIFVVLLALALQYIPHFQVAQFELSNATVVATLENQYRTTLAQILGGIAVGIGIYFAWGNFTTAREGQITERFTRAVDQLGSNELEIKLGGIYALERIANESDKDYWSIMEVLTAYVRKNSIVIANVQAFENKKVADMSIDILAETHKNPEYKPFDRLSLDLQTILNVIGRRKYLNRPPNSNRFYSLDLNGSHLPWAYLHEANLEETEIVSATLENSFLSSANLSRSLLLNTSFKYSVLSYANLEGANLERADLQGADLQGANLEEADLEGVDLEGAKNLTIDQLSKAKTLYNSKLDPELEKPLKEKYPDLFKEPKDKP